MMTKYRIGRIEGDWVNFTPPIRGGIYREDGEETEASLDDSDDASADWSSSLESWNSSTTSLDSNHNAELAKPPLTISHTIKGPVGLSSSIEVLECQVEPRYNFSIAPTVKCKHLTEESALFVPTSPQGYIWSAEQEIINNEIRDNPSLDAQTQRMVTAKYQRLHQRIKDEGFYDCDYLEYGKEVVRYTILFTLFIACLRAEWYNTSALFLGLFWQQIMFTAHDAGHQGITHNFIVDTLIGIFIGDFCCGLSLGWWKSSHNVHHLITNHPEHDPDIQNVPLFATSPSFFRSVHSSYYNFTYHWNAFANVAVKYQRYTYYPVMFLARFNLYVLSWLHLLSSRSTNIGSAAWTRPVEIAGMLCYWFLFGYCLLWLSIPTWKLRVAFVLVSHIATMPLHVQITLSHWAMPTADLGDAESFPQRQLRTTMDIDCPEWLDFIHGGLQFQVVHHLFPRVPRHNLRKLQVLVMEFCKETGIEYKIYGFVDGNKQVLGRLGEISKQVEMLVKCQAYMAETGESGLH
ncbi:hypothetical protein N7G274_006535 [Stereocaulon virgatum]|uniref:Fatty acid desaturase domain-containing protein n=1 Tax=Stereocaulon virgatum TaxID=373712 RepID=A0ABR4A5C1_9LECA